METLNLTPFTFNIFFDNKNISVDISKYLMSFSYTDKVAGEADELELELDDTDTLWQNEWYPKTGATLSAEISNNVNVLNCGAFYLDEIEFSADTGGDVVSIRALSAFFNKKLRTKHSKAHESKSLAEIARTVAQKHGLKVQGTIADVVIGRVTQHKKNDLAFLQQLANEYGYAFNVRNNVMTFTDITKLEAGKKILTIDKSDCNSVKLKDKTSETYKRANVSFHNPTTKETVGYASAEDSDTEAADTLEVRGKAENTQQAERIGEAALHNANSVHVEGSIETEGNPLLVSGVNIELAGCGRLSGLYHITSSTHKHTRGDGYKTVAEIKKVGPVAPALQISKKAKKAVVNDVLVNVQTRYNLDNVGFNFLDDRLH